MSTIGMKRNKNQSQSTEQAQEFVKSVHWINVGIQTSEGFVSLPMNIALDSMKESKGSSELAQRKNKLMMKLRELCEELEPGEGKIVNLSVQIYKIPEEKPQLEDEDFDAALDSIA